MPKNVIQYSLLVSCPEDIKEEVQVVQECVDRFNDQFTDSLGISIVSKHWSKNSYAQSGGKPQELLNKQFVNNCDAAVAIFWTHFGTPTDHYGSGTEEEIETMIASGKQVFMYFSDKPISPSKHNPLEYEKIQAFRNKYKGRGLYFVYSTIEEFEKMFFAHLTQYFITEKKVDEIKKERFSSLKLLGIDGGNRICDYALYMDFVPCVDCSSTQYVEKIRNLFHEISTIKLEKSNLSMPGLTVLSASFDKPVEIERKDIDLITRVAEQLGIGLENDFFCLGDLSRCVIPYDVLGGRPVSGSEQEKKKYNLINSLIDTIWQYLRWAPIEKILSTRKCIKLALQNSGTSVDEDVEITFSVPKSYWPDELFPELNTENKESLLNDYYLNRLFGINSTPEYLDYDSSIVKNQSMRNYQPPLVSPLYSPDYDEEFDKALNCAFCYSVYESGEYIIVKLKFEYIKHNTTVAFPTAIFLNEPVGSIEYSITSKNAPEVITGAIMIQEDSSE